MTRLFVGNFEFEHQLAAGDSAFGQLAVPRTAVELASAWIGIAQPGDALWMPEPPDPDYFRDIEGLGLAKTRCLSSAEELAEFPGTTLPTCCPWGWSSQQVKWAQARNLPAEPPPREAVREANSRRFSFELECELDTGLENAAQIRSVEDWQAALQAFAADAGWVIKSEFGMSARERLLGRGPKLTESQMAWGRKRLLSGQALILEPWVLSLGEAGLQFEIPQPGQGMPHCLGIAPMVTHQSGRYRGSRFDLSAETDLDWSWAVAMGHTAARRAQGLGYFGPLGIDAMWYRDSEGNAKLRPLQDLNARWTMGRLSLGFRSLLAAGELGAWMHLRCPAKTRQQACEWWNTLPATLPKEVRLLRTSPLTTGGQVTGHATAVLIAPEAKSLSAATQQLLA